MKQKIVGLLLALAVIAFVFLCYYLADMDVVSASHGETMRNWALTLGVPIGIGLAVWRSRVAGRQADIAERSLLHDRYQRGADMLGNDTLATRIGGIYALERLAREHAYEYHIQIMDLLCAFIRMPYQETGRDTQEEHSDEENNPRCRQDVEAAAIVIVRRSEYQIKVEEKHRQASNESNNRWGLNLEGANLAHASLGASNLSYANLRHANLVFAHLMDADLSYANLQQADLFGAFLFDSNLSGALMGGVKGVTQSTLDGAVAKAGEDPDLESGVGLVAVCIKTGKPLVWRGGQSKPSR